MHLYKYGHHNNVNKMIVMKREVNTKDLELSIAIKTIIKYKWLIEIKPLEIGQLNDWLLLLRMIRPIKLQFMYLLMINYVDHIKWRITKMKERLKLFAKIPSKENLFKFKQIQYASHFNAFLIIKFIGSMTTLYLNHTIIILGKTGNFKIIILESFVNH